jgi:small subunit ribosomal protein S7
MEKIKYIDLFTIVKKDFKEDIDIVEQINFEYYNKNILCYLVGKLNYTGKRKKMIKKILQVFSNLKIESNNIKKPLELIMECVIKVVPFLRLKSKRVGGVIYKLPVPLKMRQEFSRGLKWLINNNKQKKKVLVPSLVNDIILSRQNLGEVVKYKENDYKVAILNRPFVKYLK